MKNSNDGVRAAGGVISLFALFVLAEPAQAGTRDDVVSAAVRCAAIAGDRAWLDCYYGAAQPMRTRLALPPAPAAQIRLVPAALGTPSPYQSALPTPMPAAAAPSPAPAAAARQKHGFLDPAVNSVTAAYQGVKKFIGPQPVGATNMPLMSYEFRAHGLFRLVLDNGQTWTQSPDDAANIAHWKGPAPNILVTIAPAPDKSFHLTVVGDSHVYKVVHLDAS